ncbi:uncharacterized protein LOC122289367 [Carya illinoinensis]|uniref:uncharacterized protein LOC122289367 n=1 Tax=Carya illinoinensis TaxID=32201 RepID=UPI001C71DD91|nr:uncharacterized protein LOC122289367 [Carya illinoinensis]
MGTSSLLIHQTIRRDVKWQPPDETRYKVNWDAGFKTSTSKMGAGIIIRNFEREVIAALGMPRAPVSDPSVAEANALWRVVVLCKEIGITNAVFEDDARNIISEVQQTDQNFAWYGQIIEDIKLIYNTRQRWTIQYAQRECNLAAHKLAQFALQCDNELVWLEDISEWKNDCIQLKKNVILRMNI